MSVHPTRQISASSVFDSSLLLRVSSEINGGVRRVTYRVFNFATIDKPPFPGVAKFKLARPRISSWDFAPKAHPPSAEISECFLLPISFQKEIGE